MSIMSAPSRTTPPSKPLRIHIPVTPVVQHLPLQAQIYLRIKLIRVSFLHKLLIFCLFPWKLIIHFWMLRK
jgi:hypothetical protein